MVYLSKSISLKVPLSDRFCNPRHLNSQGEM